MNLKRMRIIGASLCAALLAATGASAQVFGTFSWQMQPYCNVVTVTLTQFPGGYTLDGNDNQCGAATLAAVTGQALIHPDGTVGVNFALVTSPSGTAVHVAAVVSPASGSGTWVDSVGNSGTFTLAGNTAGLPPRPLPASGLGVGVVTTTELAAGAVGAADINTAEVQARVSGTCASGQVLAGINANGTVVCSSGDQGGQLARSIITGASLPAAVDAAGEVGTLTFVAAKTGTALLRSRGYCQVQTDTVNAVNVRLKIVLDGDLTFGTDFWNMGAIYNPAETPAITRVTSFQVETELPVTGGTTYTVDLIGTHVSGAVTNATTCVGSMTAVVH